MDHDKGKPDTEWRTSRTHFLPSQGDAMLRAIDQRVADLTRQPKQHQEDAQVLRYDEGQFYSAHHDFFNGKVCEQHVQVMILLLLWTDMYEHRVAQRKHAFAYMHMHTVLCERRRCEAPH